MAEADPAGRKGIAAAAAGGTAAGSAAVGYDISDALYSLSFDCYPFIL